MNACDEDDEVANLDAVLAGVNQLIECLKIEINDENHTCFTTAVDAKTNQNKSYPDDANKLISGLNDFSTSENIFPGNKVDETGASKQVATGKSDKDEEYKKNERKLNKTDIPDTSAIPSDSNDLCKFSDAALTSNGLNEISRDAKSSFEKELCEKKTDSVNLDLLTKQMTKTLSEVESPRMSNKATPSSETMSYLEKQTLDNEEIDSKVNAAARIAQSNTVNCSATIENSTRDSRESVDFNEEKLLEDNNHENKKVFKKAHSENCGPFFRDVYRPFSVSSVNEGSIVNDIISECHEPTEINKKRSEKTKLGPTHSLPAKLVIHKEGPRAAIKALLPKRKISRGKEPVELKKFTSNQTNFSCFHSGEEGRRKNSSSFELQDPSVPVTTKASNKSKGSTKGKGQLSRQKKIGLYFRRSLSSEGKKQEEDLENKMLKLKKELFSLTSPEVEEEQRFSKKRNAGLSSAPIKHLEFSFLPDQAADLMNAASEVTDDRLIKPDCSFNSAAYKTLNSNNTTGGPEQHGRSYSSDQTDIEGEVNDDGSDDGTDFLAYEEGGSGDETFSGGRRRSATADSTLIQRISHKWPLQNNESTTIHSSMPRDLNQSPIPSHTRLGIAYNGDKRNWELAVPANGRVPGDPPLANFLDESFPRSGSFSNPRGIRGKKQLENEQQGLESISRLASKLGKKNKLRKSLKKTASVPVPDADELAERTWGPEGDCTWSNMSGRKVELGSTRLQSLSELECDALQKVAINRLLDAELGVTIVVPKDESKILNRKVSLKKKYGMHLSLKEKNRDKNFDHVFGIPLVNVVENDQLLRLQKSASFAPPLEYQDSLNDPAVMVGASSSPSSNSSCSGSCSSIHNNQQAQSPNHEREDAPNGDIIKKALSDENLLKEEFTPAASPDPTECDNVFHKEHNTPTSGQTPNSAKTSSSTAAQPLRRRGAIAADSINQIDPYQSQLLEALSLSVSGTTHNQRKEKKRSLLPRSMAQVPYVVQKCCDHIKKYGLDVTGIFRIAGSKKRVRQLREEFDRGMDVTIDEDYNPHDVAALLKEFFRDLPESLLTRELYPAFIQTTKLPKQERLSDLRCLLWLLPLTNRDTLQTLLNFLAVVATHSEVTTDSAGNKVPGNKMTTANLAMIFGPNILHRYKKSGQNDFQNQNLEKPEESTAVIKVVEDLIINQVQLFQIPKEEHDEMLRALKETDPEAVDFLLRRKAANHMREKSRLISGNSPSPNLTRRFPQPVSPENGSFNSPVGSTTKSNACNGCTPERENQQSTTNSNNDSPRVYSSMRLSYQQATGHAAIPSAEEKREKGTKLKFKRPFFKTGDEASNKQFSDVEERNSNNSSEREDNSEDAAEQETEKRNGEVTDTTATPQGIATTLVTSSAMISQRSMSFTDDDLQAILGSRLQMEDDHPVSYRKTREDLSAPLIIEDREHLQFEEEIERALLEDVEDLIPYNASRDARSSDSGISEVSVKNPVSSSPDIIKRRGGFSLLIQPSSNAPQVNDVDPDERTEKENDFSSKQNAFTREQDPEYNFQPSVAEDEGIHENPKISSKDDKTSASEIEELSSHFKSSMKVKINEQAYIYNKNNNNNNNNNDHHRHNNDNNSNYHGNRRTSQILRLCPETLSAINAVLNPEPRQLEFDFDPQDPTENDDEDQDIEQPRPKPLPRTRLPSGLSPRVQRQYGPPSQSTCENFYKINAEMNFKQCDHVKVKDQDIHIPTAGTTADRIPATKPRHLYQKETFHDSLPQRNQHLNPRHEMCRKQPDTNVATLVRRYSKDDLALTRDIQRTPGARWTSPGLLGQQIDANHNVFKPKEDGSLKGKEALRVAPPSGHLSWHAAMLDRQHLPETLV